ncbi:MAG: hypothetical protein QXH27_02460 [Candidatus Micrarchaeia archaeon]
MPLERIQAWMGRNAFVVFSIFLCAALFLFTRSAVAAFIALALAGLVKWTRDAAPQLLLKAHETKAFYYAIALLLALAFLSKGSAFSEGFALAAAAAAFALLLAESVVNAELKKGATGWGKEAKEVVVAVATALALWFGLSLLLGTSSPLDAVVSCSMLPALERGDIVLLHGGEVSAPVANVPKEAWSALAAGNAFRMLCGICVDAAGERPCLLDPAARAEVKNGSFVCGWCERQRFSGGRERVPCAKGVVLAGKTIPVSTANDVIVYEPLPADAFARSGSIIHRVQAAALVDGKTYYFTKGDNNPQFDVQVGNEPVAADRSKGRVIARAPYLGYFKLLLSGMLGAPPGCDAILK